MRENKVVVLHANEGGSYANKSEIELNKFLKDGWLVESVTSMNPSSPNPQSTLGSNYSWSASVIVLCKG